MKPNRNLWTALVDLVGLFSHDHPAVRLTALAMVLTSLVVSLIAVVVLWTYFGAQVGSLSIQKILTLLGKS